MLGTLRSMFLPAVLALACIATSASADPLMDVAGPPTAPGSSTSFFSGDLSNLTGTLTFDDLIVSKIEFGNGSIQTYPSGLDPILGAAVKLTAHFVNGSLSGAGNFLKIVKGATTFFDGLIDSASLQTYALFNGYNFVFAVGHTGPNPTVAHGASPWLDGNLGIDGSFAWILTSITASPVGRGDVGLVNVAGKLTPNPEPGTLCLFGLAALGGILVRRRQRAAKAAA